MKIIAIAFTQKGGMVARSLTKKIDADGYIISTHPSDGLGTFSALDEIAKIAWENYDAIVFVGACGIAVRAIAPYVDNKATDRAVVVVDEMGKYAIPILSGHIGGANDLAKKIAAAVGAEAVITTATDINGKFSADTFAVKNHMRIGDTKIIKEISSRILHGKKIGLYSDYPLKNVPDIFSQQAYAGICISDENKKPFEATLNLFPKTAVLGIGCRRGCETVTDSLTRFLEANKIPISDVRCVVTIDIKKNEPGIVDFCGRYSLPLLTFSASELRDTKGKFTSSEFVRETVGVDNVCERAVVRTGARLTHKKTVIDGVTAALGRLVTEFDFEGH